MREAEVRQNIDAAERCVYAYYRPVEKALTISDYQEHLRLKDSPWRFGILIERPAEYPKLLPSRAFAHTFEQLCDGRSPVAAIGVDKIVLAAKVLDDSRYSNAVGWIAAKAVIDIVRFPLSAITSVHMMHDDRLAADLRS